MPSSCPTVGNLPFSEGWLASVRSPVDEINYHEKCAILCLCEKGRYSMNLRLNYSHVPPTLNSSEPDHSSRVSLAGEESNLLYLFWGHFKDLTSIVCADGNCLGQGLQINCRESVEKNCQCGEDRFGNKPFQDIWWRMEGWKGPHSPIHTTHISTAAYSATKHQTFGLPIQN